MIGHKRIPSREGGVEVVVEELATRMADLGHEVTCYNRGGKHVLDKKQKIKKIKNYKGVKIKRVFTIDAKGLAAASSSFFGSWKILFSKADVVHYHAEGPCVMIPIIKWFSKKKVVVTIHGLDWKQQKWGTGFASKYIRFGEKTAAKYADEIIVLSNSTKKYFMNTYHRETIHIPNGIAKPEKLKANIITKKYGLKKDDYILFLGRLIPDKGVHHLIEAFSRIKTDKKLVIAGSGSDTNEYEKKLKEMAGDNVIFTGFVEGAVMQELYSNAYIYCLPSRLEGMPLGLLEAMSYGSCCVVSDIDVCVDMAKNKAIFFKESNVDDLTAALAKVINNSQIVKTYRDKLSQFATDYDWDDVVQKTIEVYRDE